MYHYNAVVTNVVDGDTFDLDIDLGFHIHIHERIRLMDVDTPECRGAERELGFAVASYAEGRYLSKSVIIHSLYELLPKTDSFGRWLVDVILDGVSAVTDYNEHGFNKKSSTYDEKAILRYIDEHDI